LLRNCRTCCYFLVVAIVLCGNLTLGAQTVEHHIVEANDLLSISFPDGVNRADTGLIVKERKIPRIGIVLSGGGSRGFAQIGVLKVIEEMHLPIHAIVGTSIGGLVGGLYASGYKAAELDSIIRATRWEELLGIGEESQRTDLFVDQKIENDRSLVTLRLDGFSPRLPEAISSGTRMTQFIERLVWGSLYHSTGSFDNLKYRFRATATDLVSGRLVVLDSGNLALAIRAGATIPLRFTPVGVDSMMLVDGGLLANIPVQVARDMGCDLVIVINTTSPLQAAESLESPWNVADQVVTLMMRQLSQPTLDDADLVITPDLSGLSGTDFSHTGALIDSGEAAARRMFDTLKNLTDHATGDNRQDIVRNVSIACRDQNLLASLGLERQPPTIELNDFKRRLEELRRSGTFRDIAAKMVSDGDSLRLVLSGVRSPAVDSVVIHGARRVGPAQFHMVYDKLAGQRLNNDSIGAASESVLRLLRRRGFSFVRIDSTRFDDGSGTLDVYVDEGIIRRIRFDGLVNCAEFVVARELDFSRGDLFEADRVGAAVNRIMNTGYFKQAAIEAFPLPGGGLEVVVKVQERSTALMRLSAGVTSERYTRLGIELAQENLFGFGTRISARFAGGLRDRFAALELGSNRIYGTFWTFRTRGYGAFRNVNVFDRHVNPDEGVISRSALGEYREFRVGALARFGRQVERFGVVSIEGRFERQGTRNLTIPATDEKWRTITTLKFGTRFDTEDRFPYPRSGTLIDISYETAQHLLGADESFSKFSIEAGYTAPLGRRHVIHPRIRMGLSDITLPLLEQFSLGGQYSMYGLREDESRGRQLLLASLEYRYMLPFKLYFDTYLSLRYDLGSTWLTPTEIRMNELEHGFGLSIGLDTPLGPADFALGRSFIFNKNGVPTLMYFGPVVAYFSFGFPFN
jgi:NTE family protein